MHAECRSSLIARVVSMVLVIHSIIKKCAWSISAGPLGTGRHKLPLDFLDRGNS